MCSYVSYFRFYISDTIWYSSFFLWLTLLNIVISRSNHVVTNGLISLFFYGWVIFQWGIFHWVSQVVLLIKNLPANARDLRDTGSIPGSGRSSRERNGNPVQYSCLENPMDRGSWQAIVHRVEKSGTWLKWLSTHIQLITQSSLSCRKTLDLWGGKKRIIPETAKSSKPNHN